MRGHFVFDVKPSGLLKARFVAGGNTVNSTGIESSMTVVETPNTRILFAIAEANGQEVLIGDLSSAYLHARTREKVYFICGSEWGVNEGCVAIVEKVIYGLVGSANAFHSHSHHSHVFSSMTGLGWTPCEGDQNIWMRRDKANDVYDYIAYYVDDFASHIEESDYNRE